MYSSKKFQLKFMVLYELHDTPTTGHSGFTKSYDNVKLYFLWDGMKGEIRTFVANCDVYQCNKGEMVKAPRT
jgi:hypothetical protein